MDVRLIGIDQEVAVTLSPRQQALEGLDKDLPLRRVGPAEQLPGLLPGQLAAVQGRPDGLAADQASETLPHVNGQAPQCPARRWVSSFYRRSGRAVLGSAHELAEAGLDVGTKGGRPPVRR